MKHVAIFGLNWGVLRKQLVKLFLNSWLGEAPQRANGGSGYFKHGAMFGLDARIALSIFGALSVISGTAIVSSIQRAKSQQLYSTFKELSKSIESYYLDTGYNLPLNTYENSGYGRLHIGDLVINKENLRNWNGPYFSATTVAMQNILRNPIAEQYSTSATESWFVAYIKTGATWSENEGLFTNRCSLDPDNCYHWIGLNIDENEMNSVFNILDEKFDGSDGDLAGNIRLYKWSTRWFIVYKSFVRRSEFGRRQSREDAN